MKKDKKEQFVPGKTRIKYGGAYTDQSDFDAIQSVLDRNWWTIDEHGREFERELKEYAEVDSVTLTNSGSSAILVGLAGMNYPEGSEIITGGVHFPTTISSMYYNRLTPVYVDISDYEWGINVNLIEQAITEKTVAIMAVALIGSTPNMKVLGQIADKHGIDLILDNCDGFGSTIDDKPVEHYADLSFTSFHAAHITAMGEGGAVFVNKNDVEISERVASLREWGRIGDNDDTTVFPDLPSDYPGRYIFKNMGFNVKPLELQCAMGRSQFKKLQDIKKRRQINYDTLYHGLQDIKQIKLLSTRGGYENSWFGFPFIAEYRKGLRPFLEKRQIETRTIFGGNITKQPAFRGFGRVESGLPVSDLVGEEGMFVSVHPDYGKEEMEYIIKSIKEFYAKG